MLVLVENCGILFGGKFEMNPLIFFYTLGPGSTLYLSLSVSFCKSLSSPDDKLSENVWATQLMDTKN